MNGADKFNLEDTIAAVSAPIGGPISIIRMSGAESLAILDKIFVRKGRAGFESHRIYYGWIEAGGERIDEVLATVMLGPRTFTREDVVEINCHGGAWVVQKILMLLLEEGARLAEPGEFTKRAFLNGRIDLSQAEAVIDIINAKSDLSHRAAVAQLEGRLGKLLNDSCEKLVNALARIEMAIDYPEHEEAGLVGRDIMPGLVKIAEGLERLLTMAGQGRIIREGIKTAIVGEPNVGKSSLLNALAQSDRAIVTHVPGTTRDVLRESIRLKDIFLEVADTAGLRETDDIVESEGVKRSIQEGQNADLVLLVLDGSRPVTNEQIAALGHEKWENIIAVVNKTDLRREMDMGLVEEIFGPEAVVEISAKNNEGIEELAGRIRSKFLTGKIEYKQDIVTNVRHIALIKRAREAVGRAVEATRKGMFVDLVAIDIQDAYAALGEVTGIVVEEELLERIFSEFCLGK